MEPIATLLKGENMFLQVDNISARYDKLDKMVVENVSFALKKGNKLGIVGESGSGKSTILKILAGFQPYFHGQVRLEDKIVTCGIKDLKWLSKKLQVVFQNPVASLDPKQTIANTLEEPLINFFSLSTKERKQKILDIVEAVNLNASILDKKANSLSGGEAQRVCIARCLLAKPDLLLCDEPVTNLDMTTQTQIIKLIKSISEQQELSVIFVSHDISLVLEICDEVVVLKEGKVLDYFATKEWYKEVRHPYTKELINALKIV